MPQKHLKGFYELQVYNFLKHLHKIARGKKREYTLDFQDGACGAGGRILFALKHINDAIDIDEKVLTNDLNEVSRALLAADVQVHLVSTLQLVSRHNKRRINYMVISYTKFICVCIYMVVVVVV